VTGSGSPPQGSAISEWRQEFGISRRSRVSAGRNSYFILEPGFQLVFASKDAKLVITVQEGSAPNPAEKEFKLYAPNIGLIQDGDTLLVKHGFREK
jgi:hypothetical protein